MDNGWRCCEEKSKRVKVGVTTVYKGLQRPSQVYKGRGEEKEKRRRWSIIALWYYGSGYLLRLSKGNVEPRGKDKGTPEELPAGPLPPLLPPPVELFAVSRDQTSTMPTRWAGSMLYCRLYRLRRWMGGTNWPVARQRITRGDR